MAESLSGGGLTSRRGLLSGVGLGALAVGLVASSKEAQATIAVVDSGAISQMATQVRHMAEANKTLSSVSLSNMNLLASLGKQGGLNIPVPKWQRLIASGLDSLTHDVSRYPAAGGVPASFGTIGSAQKFFAKTLFRDEGGQSSGTKRHATISQERINPILESRDMALQDAAAQGMAYAAHAKQSVPATSREAEQLVSDAGRALDLREQIAVLNRGVAALLQELAMQRTGLALIVENLSVANAKNKTLTFESYGGIEAGRRKKEW